MAMSGILAFIQGRLEALPVGLRQHIHRVEVLSVELALAHHVSQERARLCARAHDLCRAMKDEELLRRARELSIAIHPVEERMPILLHGPVAAELLRREGLEDEGVYQGVYYHTTAGSGLEPVAKVVFLADKLDPRKIRRYPYIPDLKMAALESLDRALLEFLNREMGSATKGSGLAHPASVEAREELLARGVDAALGPLPAQSPERGEA
jgi:predicted HD superfamily hydrolase involved in NAD metabolism